MLQNLIAQFVSADKVRKVIERIFTFYVNKYSKKNEDIRLVISKKNKIYISLLIDNKFQKNIEDNEIEDIIKNH